jgi:D-alanine-D-alanine ligase-like ATP-grasp enzyme
MFIGRVKMLARRGQSILEYTIMVGIVTVVLFYMGTSVKRGVQSLVKITADQVGIQQNADQDFNDTQQGYMVASNSITNDSQNKQVTEIGYIPASGNAVYLTNTSYNDSYDVMTNTSTNAGFTPSQ